MTKKDQAAKTATAKQSSALPLVSAADPTGGHEGPKDEKEETDGPRPFLESEADVLGVADNKGVNDGDALFKRIRESGLYYVKNHVLEQEYVGISPQADPKADSAAKAKSTVTGLDVVPPRTGMEVRLKDGTSFVIPDGFGLDTTPKDWGAVSNPATGKALFG